VLPRWAAQELDRALVEQLAHVRELSAAEAGLEQAASERDLGLASDTPAQRRHIAALHSKLGNHREAAKHLEAALTGLLSADSAGVRAYPRRPYRISLAD
jgi:hypothetical protein